MPSSSVAVGYRYLEMSHAALRMPHAAGMQQQRSSATFSLGVVAAGQDVALSVVPGQVPQTTQTQPAA